MKNQKKFKVVPILEIKITGLKKVPVYNFSELSSDIQEKLINNFDVDRLRDNFFDFAIDDEMDYIKQDVFNKYGLLIKIFYDLSYCQGSGASFITDMTTGKELETFIKTAFPEFVKSFRFSEILFPYFCECMELEFNEGRSLSYNVPYYEADFNPDKWERIDDYLTGKLEELDKLITDFSIMLSSQITRKLYNAYEEYTGDENIKGILSDNLYFKDGTLAEEAGGI